MYRLLMATTSPTQCHQINQAPLSICKEWVVCVLIAIRDCDSYTSLMNKYYNLTLVANLKVSCGLIRVLVIIMCEISDIS